MTGEHDPRRPAYSNEGYGAGGCHCTVRQNQDRAEEKKAGDEALSAFLAGYVDDMKVAVGEALTEQKNAPESPEASAENTQSQEGTSKEGTGTPSSEPEPAPTPSASSQFRQGT